MFFRFNQLFKLCVTWANLLKRILFTQQLNDRTKQKGHWNSGSSRALSISALWMAETVTWLCIMLYFVLRQWRGVTSLRCSVAVPAMAYTVLSSDEYTCIHHYTTYKTPEGTAVPSTPTLTVGPGRRTTSGLLSCLHSVVLNLKRVMVTRIWCDQQRMTLATEK